MRNILKYCYIIVTSIIKSNKLVDTKNDNQHVLDIFIYNNRIIYISQFSVWDCKYNHHITEGMLITQAHSTFI